MSATSARSRQRKEANFKKQARMLQQNTAQTTKAEQIQSLPLVSFSSHAQQAPPRSHDRGSDVQRTVNGLEETRHNGMQLVLDVVININLEVLIGLSKQEEAQ